MRLPHDKARGACELLDEALRAYFARRFVAALHLAGAAEEVFGRMLQRGERRTALAAAIDRLVRLAAEHHLPLDAKAAAKVLNAAKNAIKHVDSDPRDLWVDMDAELEAWSMLTRAAENFEALGRADLPRPPLLDAFWPTPPTLRRARPSPLPLDAGGGLLGRLPQASPRSSARGSEPSSAGASRERRRER